MRRLAGLLLILVIASGGRVATRSSPSPAITFASPITLPTPVIDSVSVAARGVVVADANNDGRPDVIVSDLNHDRVLVYLADGFGAYSLVSGIVPTGSEPVNIAAGDFDRDGFVDLAISNYPSGSEEVLFGNGDGTFGAETFYPVTGPGGNAVGDFNNDGWLDIATAGQFAPDNGTAILINNHDRTFTLAGPFVSGSGGDHNQIAVGEFSEDGILDIADRPSVILGDGTGQFGAPLNFGTPCSFSAGDTTSVVTGDFNGDGHLDLVIGASRRCHSINLLLGAGDGTFHTLPLGGPDGDLDVGIGMTSMAVADFDDNGTADLALLGSAEAEFRVFPGNGDGTFGAPSVVPTAGFGELIAVADLNGDGLPDVVTTLATDPTIFLNTTVTSAADLAPPAINCAAADNEWHGANVNIPCSASDSGSGLANSSDQTFDLMTDVAAGNETANALTDSHTVCDLAGNCATAGPIGGNRIDRRNPSITITAPTPSTYLLGQTVNADYTCTDSGAGIAACDGTVARGAPIDTDAVGSHALTANAADAVGNNASLRVDYKVAFGIEALYDQSKPVKSGATIPIRLRLTDAAAANRSSAAIAIVATQVVFVATSTTSAAEDSGNANPDANFRYDASLGGYIFNLSTKGLSAGYYRLEFVATADPTVHSVLFQIGR